LEKQKLKKKMKKIVNIEAEIKVNSLRPGQMPNCHFFLVALLVFLVKQFFCLVPILKLQHFGDRSYLFCNPDTPATPPPLENAGSAPAPRRLEKPSKIAALCMLEFYAVSQNNQLFQNIELKFRGRVTGQSEEFGFWEFGLPV